MIPRSPLVAVLAVGLALAAHAALLVETDQSTVEIDGGGSVAPAALGNSFADLTQGIQSPVATDDADGTVQQEAPVVTPVQPTEQAHQAIEPPPSVVQQVEVVQQLEPDQNARAPSGPAAISPAPVVRAEVVAVSEAPQVTPVETAAATPSAVIPVAPPPTAAQDPVAQARVQAHVQASVQTNHQASPPVEARADLAPQHSPRPATRPERPKPRERQAEVKPVVRAAPVQPPSVSAPARGNSNRNARAGAETGDDDQPAAQAASAQPAKASGEGNAATANYAGKVMRQIHRQRKARTSLSGVTYVHFVIGPAGDLTSLRIAKSSGAAALDKLALTQVQRASPFPRPPAGARRDFTIGIKSD
ncbi:TonB family protein [Tritonibacter horizontis]|uniref:Gram-negative bacterial tonB protein n=1 Tax=Tritonibacter horizontis TaxID=1768241 RepID=A0A132BUU4_9RHOB|nr:TonB family protein [Tritonibacter horizontis]KUP91966.1 gram-negative bacterial tonB protein [Tritonibacter horizontis]